MRCSIICHPIAFADASDCDYEDFFGDRSLFRQKTSGIRLRPCDSGVLGQPPDALEVPD